MTFVADVDIRRLVGASRLLEPRIQKDEHLLGLGIPRRKAYPHLGSAATLPAREDGLVNLRSATGNRAHDLSADRSKMAWGHLLGSPDFTVPLTIPSEVELYEAGIAVTADSRATLVRVGLVTVVHLPGESLEAGVLSGTRLAGVGTLTLRPNASLRYFDDAWLEAIWTTSTTGLSSAMELLVPKAAGVSSHKFDQHQVMVILAGSWANRLSPQAVMQVKIAAHVFGLSVDVVNGTPKNFGAIQSALTQHLPRHVIVVGKHDGTSRGLASAFTANGGRGEVVNVDDLTGRNILPALREVFASLTGISAGLLPLPPVEAVEQDTAIGAWSALMLTFVECRHDASERQYRRDRSTGRWWTRDTAGHGGSAFKSYELVDDHLSHLADHDGNGNVLENKFKGAKGKTVRVSDLHGCGSDHVTRD